MRRWLVLLGLAVLAGVSLWVAKRHPAPRPLDLSIRFTCDVRGRLAPCGCFDGQMGGLSRISSVLDQTRGAPTLRCDVGNALEGPADYQVLQYKQLLQAFGLMNFDAINLGHAEAQLSRDRLRAAVADSAVPVISANLLNAESRLPLVKPYVIAERGGWRIALVGVMDENVARDSIGSGLAIEPMDATLERLIPEVRQKADFLVLLAFADEARLRKLAAEFYEADVILGGDVSQPAQHLERLNRSLILYTTNRSRALGMLDLTLAAGARVEARRGEVILVGHALPEDPKIQALERAYRDKVRKADLAVDHPENGGDDVVPGVRSSARYLGSASCIACHGDAAHVWNDSGHARAFYALEAVGAGADPSCLPCHTVGFGTPSGYRRSMGESVMAGVGCESCHGPGSGHVAERTRGEAVSHFRPLGAQDCVNCHHGEFSRPFSWEEFWPRVAHGPPVQGAPRAN